VVSYCKENGIVVEAYCPIVRNRRADDPVVKSVADKLTVTPNQVLLRYCLQKGIVPLTKSDNPDRMKTNADLYEFDIAAEEMAVLDGLDRGYDGTICPHNWPLNIA
jgi:diketogulonate reductase-like aldo/keto reductase